MTKVVEFIAAAIGNADWSAATVASHGVRSRRLPKRFRIFRSELDVPIEFDIVGGSVEVWATWEGWERSVE